MTGFIRFTEPTVVVVPTIADRIALLSAAQKTNLLNYFIMGKGELETSRDLKINRHLVKTVLDTIDELQQTARMYMRGEIIVSPAVYNATGDITTPVVMNTPPDTQIALGTILQPLFASTFTSGQVTAIITAMIKWSKYDGTGTFAFYQTNIKL